MRGIYRFTLDCGRNGELSGLFIAEAMEVESAMGEEVYLSDVLGKHSEINLILDDDCIELVTSDGLAIDVFEKYNLRSGINPLDYIE